MYKGKRFFFVCGVLFAFSTYGISKTQEVEVPRTVYKDTYKYYVIEEGKQATLNYITLRRQSFDSILYIKAEVNCPSRYIRQVGSSTRSVKEIRATQPTQWLQPTIGMAEWDIVSYVCR